MGRDTSVYWERNKLEVLMTVMTETHIHPEAWSEAKRIKDMPQNGWRGSGGRRSLVLLLKVTRTSTSRHPAALL